MDPEENPDLHKSLTKNMHRSTISTMPWVSTKCIRVSFVSHFGALRGKAPEPAASAFNPSTPKFKSTFSQPLEEKCRSEVVRIGSIIIFDLSQIWKAKFFILCGVICLVREAAGKFWNWSLLGVKGLTLFPCWLQVMGVRSLQQEFWLCACAQDSRSETTRELVPSLPEMRQLRWGVRAHEPAADPHARAPQRAPALYPL